MDETSLKMDTPANTEFLCAAVNHAVNTEPDESGYSPSQWVLGKNLRLPYEMLSPFIQAVPGNR